MTKRTKLSAPMTLREFAIELDDPRFNAHRVTDLRRLRRFIVRRQRLLRAEGHDVTLWHCDGQRSAGYVTRAELLGWMPELRERESEVVAAVRETQDELRDKLDELRHGLRELTKRAVRTELRVEKIEARL